MVLQQMLLNIRLLCISLAKKGTFYEQLEI